MAKVAVITPVYNAEKYLSLTIDSVLAQVCTDWELILVNDGSKDNSQTIAEEYAAKDERIKVFYQKNAGPGAARNNGLSQISPNTQYVMFLDHDDCLLPESLVTLLQAAEANPQAVGASGLPVEVDSTGKVLADNLTEAFGYNRLGLQGWRLRKLKLDEPTDFSSMTIWCQIDTPGLLLVRADVQKQVGGFDVSSFPSEDWDMFLRLCARGSIVFVPKFVLNKREISTGLSKSGKLMAKAEPYIRRKLKTSDFFTKEQKKIATRGHFYSCLIKLTWIKEDLKRQDLKAAAKTLYRGLRSYFKFAVSLFQN